MSKRLNREAYNKKHGIKPVEKDTRQYQSRKQIERKARELKATKRSMNSVSELVLESAEEDILLNLIAKLQNITLVDRIEDLPVDPKTSIDPENADDSSSDEGESDSDENNSETEDDESCNGEENIEVDTELVTQELESLTIQSSLANNIDTSAYMLKSSFIRKLIRDDRYARKLVSNGQVESPEKIAAKIRRTMEKEKSILEPKVPVSGSKSESIQKIPSGKSTSVGSTIRMSVDCPKGKSKGQPKIMVFNRDLSVDEIIAQIRPKFNAGNKFNALRVISSNKLLDNIELMSLPDGELLHLVQELKSPVKLPKCVPEVFPNENSDAKLHPVTPMKDSQETDRKEIATMVSEIQVPNAFEIQGDNEFYQEAFDTKSLGPNPALSQEISNQFMALRGMREKEREGIETQRRSLPIYKHREEILSLVSSNQVILISGETGSGKTTQLPAYILEDLLLSQRKGSECNIVVTQPRRIAAISIAERVSYEIGEGSGNLGKQFVGYQVRLDSKYNEKTRLLYCTTGVLLRKLQNAKYFNNLSHIIIDEIHERAVETDFLLTIIKEQLRNFPHLRVILMSATLQEEKFSQYFGNCPVLYVSGRTFPVNIHFLADCHRLLNKKKLNPKDENTLIEPKFDPDLVTEIIYHLMESYGSSNRKKLNSSENSKLPAGDGKGEAILVFLSGIQQIEKLQKCIRANKNIQKLSIKYSLYLLHSSLPPEQQKKVFKTTLPGEWKIILSTNIAETSLTIDDITHVIDCGFMKEQRFNPKTQVSALQEIFISRSNASQRSGRAGRIKAGDCWRIYDEKYFFDEKKVDEYPVPEIRRIPLEEIILQILYLKLGKPETFLGQCLEAPSRQQIRSAIATLIEIKAIYPQNDLPLTALGYHLARMPVDVRIGKMLIYSCILECENPILTIAASLSCKNPFNVPWDKREEARKVHLKYLKSYEDNSIETYSDHLAIVRAFDEWSTIYHRKSKDEAYQYARRNWLSHTALLDLKATRDYYRNYLISAGFLVKETTTMATMTTTNQQKTFKKDVMNNFLNDQFFLESDQESSSSAGESSDDENSNLIKMDGKLNTTENYPDLISTTVIDDLLVRCALCAGLFPNVIRAIRVRHETKEFIVKFHQMDQQTLILHPSSLLSSRIGSLIDEHQQDAFFIYHLQIPHLILLLFTGNEITLSNSGKKRNPRKSQRVMIHSWIEMEITELQLAIYRILQKEMEKLLILYVEKNQKSSKQKHLKMAKEMKRNHELQGKVPSEVSSTSKEQSMETHEVTTDEILLNVEEAKEEEEDSSDEIHRYQHILKEILRILLRNR